MEIFVPDRDSDAVFALIRQLGELGIRGRDASYLASVEPGASLDTAKQDRYRDEFRYIVAPEQRAAAAGLLGLSDW
jgi:hypothetical protein